MSFHPFTLSPFYLDYDIINTMKHKRDKKNPIIKFLRYLKLKILRISGEPSRIALSFAVGAFIGVMPTFGIASFLSIAVAAGFKLNIIATVLGSWVSNPWTAPFFYASGYKIGEIIINKFPFLIFHFHFIHKGTKLFKLVVSGQKLILGGIIISVAISILCYYFVLETIKIHRYEKKLRRKKRQNSK